MAYVVYRAFQKGKFFAANKNLTAYFQTHSPLQQGHYWTEFNLSTKWTQQLMSCLLGKQMTLGSLLMLPWIRKNTERHGKAMLPHGTLTLPPKAVNRFKSSFSSQLLMHGYRNVTTERAFKSRFQPLLRHYRPSPRPSNWLENPVPSKQRKTTTSFPSNT